MLYAFYELIGNNNQFAISIWFEVPGMKKRNGYLIHKMKECEHTYGAGHDFNEAEKQCAALGCSHIQNNDCTKDKDFQVCYPDSLLQNFQVEPNACVYQKESKGT